MDIFKSLFASNHMLIEQLMGEMRQVLPEEGISMVVVDEQGSCWASDEQAFARAAVADEIDAIRCRIDDADEPLVIERDSLVIAAGELVGESISCGYVLLLIERDQVGQAEGVSFVIQMILNQVGLAVKLIEKNNRLHHEKLRQMAGGSTAVKVGRV